MAVVRCVCFQHSFRRLRAMADAQGWIRVAEITRATGCGSGCGGCVPYLKAMLDTRATCFAVKSDGMPPRPCAPSAWDLIDDA